MIPSVKEISPIVADRVTQINSLSHADKIKLYMHYYVSQLSIKHDTDIIDMLTEKHNKGFGEADEIVHNIHFFRPWKDVKIKSMDQFFSDDNIVIEDCGESWDKNGRARRYWVKCYGAYDWYWKFKNDITLSN